MCEHRNLSHATSADMETVCADCGEVIVTVTQELVIKPGTKIAVKKHHIENGQGGSPTSCALAKAVNDVIPQGFYANVYSYVVADWLEVVRGDKTLQRIELPYEVGEWVRRYDAMCEFQECLSDEDKTLFFQEHGDGEPFEVEQVEPFEFVVPVSVSRINASDIERGL